MRPIRPADSRLLGCLLAAFVVLAPAGEARAQTSDFSVTFLGPFPAQARTALEHALTILEQQLFSTVRIEIRANWSSVLGSSLGSARAETRFSSSSPGFMPNTLYDVALANAISGTDNATTRVDIDANFNANTPNWYFGTDANPPAGTIDFVTFALSQLIHGLAFTNSFQVGGGVASHSGQGNPQIFDRFVENGAGQSLIDTALFSNGSAALKAQIESNDVFFDGTAVRAANGGNPVKLFAPTAYQGGVSLFHLDEATFPQGNANSLMTPVLNLGEAIHSLGPITLALLRDLGWLVAGVDSDGDTLTDIFELSFGLDPNSGAGDDGAAGDPDGDTKTNAQEQSEGTHPRGFFTRFFAEGATAGGLSFATRLATANPGATPAKVNYRFLKTDGTTVSRAVSLNMMSRHTLDVATVPGMANAEFSTVCESDVVVVSDRTMEWDGNAYGSHAETSIAAAAISWNLAEGSTNGFNLFYLIQNPNGTAAAVTVTYLRPGGQAPIVKNHTVAANARFNIWVNQEDAALTSTDVSAVVASTNGVTIIVERAMYLDLPGQSFGAGHESAGVTTPALSWFFAEGATGTFFDLFILLANPNGTSAQVRADYLLPSGTVITKTYTVQANSRFNIWVDFEDAALADTAVSTTIAVTNGVTIIAERAMWFPGPSAAQWAEAHNSPGSTVTGTQWGLADGEVGGTRSLFTFILIANTSAFQASVSVKIMLENGSFATKIFSLNPNSRFNVDVGAEFPLSANQRFGAVITSNATVGGTARIVVERAMYSNAFGVVWAAGTNALATCLGGCAAP